MSTVLKVSGVSYSYHTLSGETPALSNITFSVPEGEFLAIVHALALMEQRGIKGKGIYSDSYNAALWGKKRKRKTTLARDARTAKLHEVIARAENWLLTHPCATPVLKWDTAQWGEIPADFGRK